jgi:hypothetical protein
MTSQQLAPDFQTSAAIIANQATLTAHKKIRIYPNQKKISHIHFIYLLVFENIKTVEVIYAL